MYKLYSMQRSGNSYKVRLALALLNAPYRAIEIDILRGESRTPDFLAKNPSGQVPLLEVEEGRYLAESNAILWYVAGGTPLSPEQRIARAEALQWMFFEQHALEPNIGAAYFWLSLVRGGRELQTHALEDWMERGYAALQVMENHLKTHQYFAAGQLTVAGRRRLRLPARAGRFVRIDQRRRGLARVRRRLAVPDLHPEGAGDQDHGAADPDVSQRPVDQSPKPTARATQDVAIRP